MPTWVLRLNSIGNLGSWRLVCLFGSWRLVFSSVGIICETLSDLCWTVVGDSVSAVVGSSVGSTLDVRINDTVRITIAVVVVVVVVALVVIILVTDVGFPS